MKKGGKIKINILVLEDDADLRLAVCRHLENRGYLPFGSADADDALDLMEEHHFDLIISDIMLPGRSGMEFARAVRTIDLNTPILFMTARDDMETMRQGYQLGIDEYMVKPVNLDELCLRIEALLRRARIASKKKLTVGNLELDEETMEARVNGEPVPVTIREFRLLFQLLSYPNRPFSRRQLLESYNGLDNESTPRSVDVFITGLRSKFADCDAFRIETVRGLGYKAVVS